MADINKFFEAAQNIFKLNEEGRGKRNRHYIPVPAFLSVGRLPTNDPSTSSPKLTNPFTFLTGKYEGQTSYSGLGQGYASEGSVSIIVGQYGLGKTELVHQVCGYLNTPEKKDLAPLPINLALCREEGVPIVRRIQPPDFARLLFGRVLRRAGLELSFVMKRLLPDVYDGKVLLILDGLDELISDPTKTQNHRFFSNLTRCMFAGARRGGEPPKFRVAVSMRMEYLSAAPFEDPSELAGVINRAASKCLPGVSLCMYSLQLEVLDDSRMEAYLNRRLKGYKQRQSASGGAFEAVKGNRRLLEMLRRPLLLRVFCDIAESMGQKKFHLLLDSMKNSEYPVRLIEELVKEGGKDPRLLRDQRDVTPYVWDADKLARKSLELYADGKDALTPSDVEEILRHTDPSALGANVTPRGLTDAQILEGIHKCPFLIRDGDDTSATPVRFTHRMFFEYFVARGHVLDKENAAWVNLVLNVDTRRFLRDMMETEEWFERTKRSYALDEHGRGTWEFAESLDFEELERERRLLLKYMTDPEGEQYAADEGDELLKTINSFLDKEKRLHPLYRVYNYEAIAHYVWFHRWDDHGAAISKRFNTILQESLEDVCEELASGDTFKRKALELLLERILHIGQRLRYAWVKDYVAEEKKSKVRGLLSDPNARNRLEDIFSNIERAL